MIMFQSNNIVCSNANVISKSDNSYYIVKQFTPDVSKSHGPQDPVALEHDLQNILW